jgi:hypothetical protein
MMLGKNGLAGAGHRGHGIIVVGYDDSVFALIER